MRIEILPEQHHNRMAYLSWPNLFCFSWCEPSRSQAPSPLAAIVSCSLQTLCDRFSVHYIQIVMSLSVDVCVLSASLYIYVCVCAFSILTFFFKLLQSFVLFWTYPSLLYNLVKFDYKFYSSNAIKLLQMQYSCDQHLRVIKFSQNDNGSSLINVKNLWLVGDLSRDPKFKLQQPNFRKNYSNFSVAFEQPLPTCQFDLCYTALRLSRHQLPQISGILIKHSLSKLNFH